MAFLLAAGEALEGIAGATEASADVLSGSSRLMSSNAYALPANNPIAVDPIISQDIQTPVSPNLATVDLAPRMNINIPLMQQHEIPTWTTDYDPFPTSSGTEDSAAEARDADDNSDGSGDNSGNDCKTCSQRSDFDRGFRAIKAMSLNEIAALVANNYEAETRGNVAGSLVNSGINWLHDDELTDRMQSNQREMQQRQNDWQGQQNQNSYNNQRQMQSTDIAAKEEMQQRGFAQESSMQQNQFSHENTMQGNLFSHENSMQQAGFQQQTTMQQAQFGQQVSMSNLDFSHVMAEGSQQIMGNIANTATQGVFGLIGTAIHEGVGYLEQGRDQQFQKQMQTSNFNNNIYASGNSSSALKIANPV